jgi:hypothetical protein
MTKERWPPVRTLRGWAIFVLQEAGAIPNARSTAGCKTAPTRMPASGAVDIARRHPPAGVPSGQAVAEIHDVLDSIGDGCPECPPNEAASSVLRSRP